METILSLPIASLTKRCEVPCKAVPAESISVWPRRLRSVSVKSVNRSARDVALAGLRSGCHQEVPQFVDVGRLDEVMIEARRT